MPGKSAHVKNDKQYEALRAVRAEKPPLAGADLCEVFRIWKSRTGSGGLAADYGREGLDLEQLADDREAGDPVDRRRLDWALVGSAASAFSRSRSSTSPYRDKTALRQGDRRAAGRQ